MRYLAALLLTLLIAAPGFGSAARAPAMVTVPAGSFTMGNDTELSAPIATNQPAHQVKISKFTMSKYEVTNEEFVDFLNEAEVAGDVEVSTTLPGGGEFVIATDGHPSAGQKLYDLSGTNGEGESELNRPWIDYDETAPVGTRFMLIDSQDVFGNNEALDTADWPANFVMWNGAAAFALHNSLALPTEAQWEYAAQGGQGNPFPTDDGTLTLANANYSGAEGPGEIDPGAVGHAVAVGSYPANPFGLFDLAGNVWEWTRDLYDTDFYTDTAGDKDPVSLNGIEGDGADPAESEGCKGGPSTVYTCNTRLKRGGSWNFHETTIRSEARNTDYSFRGNDHFGFRVVGSTGKPKKPGKLSAKAGANGAVTFSWTDKSNNEAFFEIECKPTPGQYSTVARTYPDAEEVEAVLEPGTKYKCRLRGVNDTAASGWRNKKVTTK